MSLGLEMLLRNGKLFRSSLQRTASAIYSLGSFPLQSLVIFSHAGVSLLKAIVWEKPIILSSVYKFQLALPIYIQLQQFILMLNFKDITSLITVREALNRLYKLFISQITFFQTANVYWYGAEI